MDTLTLGLSLHVTANFVDSLGRKFFFARGYPGLRDGLYLLDALEALDTIGSVDVSTNVTTPVDGISRGIVVMEIYVEFSRSTSVYPYHFGNLPLMEVDTSQLSGLGLAHVIKACNGTKVPWHIYSMPEDQWSTINPC